MYYYNKLKKNSLRYLLNIKKKNFFDEFGEDVSNSTNIDGFLNEYGKVIFPKDAISRCLYSFKK